MWPKCNSAGIAWNVCTRCRKSRNRPLRSILNGPYHKVTSQCLSFYWCPVKNRSTRHVATYTLSAFQFFGQKRAKNYANWPILAATLAACQSGFSGENTVESRNAILGDTLPQHQKPAWYLLPFACHPATVQTPSNTYSFLLHLYSSIQRM